MTFNYGHEWIRNVTPIFYTSKRNAGVASLRNSGYKSWTPEPPFVEAY